MLNFESIMGPKYWFGGHGFNNLKSTLSEDDCITLNIVAFSY